MPARRYNREANTVAKEYDAWTQDGVLEHYWGEHIHLGWYSPQDMAAGYKNKNFIQAKYDFIDRMLAFSGVNALATPPKKVLDVGCGIGGTSRYLAKALGAGSTVTGITLSPNQAARANALAAEQGVGNAQFQVMDALGMAFPDNSFDMVWACESGEHMPDKQKYVEEMARVLKPGGVMVVATWCQREDTPAAPFSASDLKRLDYLYAEWTHPHFISIEQYGRLMEGTKVLKDVHLEDWAAQTIASWRHSIWVGVYDPWPVVKRPWTWYKTLRDGICLDRFHRAFDDGLCGYGMFRARKSTEGYAPEDCTQ
jgi:MPBQ/MSBQ methyltransferase